VAHSPGALRRRRAARARRPPHRHGGQRAGLHGLVPAGGGGGRQRARRRARTAERHRSPGHGAPCRPAPRRLGRFVGEARRGLPGRLRQRGLRGAPAPRCRRARHRATAGGGRAPGVPRRPATGHARLPPARLQRGTAQLPGRSAVPPLRERLAGRLPLEPSSGPPEGPGVRPRARLRERRALPGRRLLPERCLRQGAGGRGAAAAAGPALQPSGRGPAVRPDDEGRGLRHRRPGDGVLGVRWRGLPCSPEELLERGKKVVHSVRFWEALDEGQIREHFRTRRLAQPPGP
jgi:hypothetical protein